MDELIKKVSYLKGFADGLDINEKTDEGKLLKKVVEALEEISDAVCDLALEHDELCEQVDAIDEDLGDLEDEIYGDDDDDCCCGCDDDDEDIECFEIECPNCKETICIDESFFDDEDKPIICPNCHKEIELDFSCDCDSCDDGCDCGCDE